MTDPTPEYYRRERFYLAVILIGVTVLALAVFCGCNPARNSMGRQWRTIQIKKRIFSRPWHGVRYECPAKP